MRLLGHMLAPLAVPLVMLGFVLAIDPIGRWFVALVLVAMAHIAWAFARWTLRGAAFATGWRLVSHR